jgi:aminocarboxymuconate-semialdehyde decarboxylase
MIVDCHAHVIVPEITRDSAPGEAWRPLVGWEDGRQFVETGGRRIWSAVREFCDAAAILEAQDAVGVDRVLLCPWVGLLGDGAEPELADRMAKIQNDGLGRLAAEHPERIGALGTVPLHDLGRAAEELRALMRRPGIVGVELPASVGGRYLGDERFEPLWQAAESTGALVFVHPTTRGFDQPVFQDYYLWNTVGNPLETAITAAHMTFAGVMEAHPRLLVLLAHGGGALAPLRGRLRHAWSFQPQARSRLERSPDESLARFLYDTVVHDQGVLGELVQWVGADHVLLGSDYPFDMGDPRPVESVRALGLPAGQEELILGAGAGRLLDRNREEAVP